MSIQKEPFHYLKKENKELNLTDLEKIELYHSIINANLDSVICINIDGIIIEWNKSAEQLYLYSYEEAIGQNILLIIPNHLKESHKKGMNHFRETKEGPILGQRLELEAIDKNGRVFPIELNISTITFRSETYFTSRSREITERKRYERQLLLTSKEMAHREKNSLAIVSAIFRQIARYSKDIEDFKSKFDSWLQSYKTSHELLSRDLVNGMSLIERVRIEFAPYNNGRNIFIEGDDILLKRHAALNFGLCLHETLTNSIKHGSLSVPNGKVYFKSVIDDKNITLTWREESGPPPKEIRDRGFGTQLLRYALIEGLQGTFDYKFPPSGFDGTVVFPVLVASQK